MDPVDEKYTKVEYIVVDPSCSGSGIVSRMDNLVDEDQATEDEMVRLATGAWPIRNFLMADRKK